MSAIFTIYVYLHPARLNVLSQPFDLPEGWENEGVSYCTAEEEENDDFERTFPWEFVFVGPFANVREAREVITSHFADCVSKGTVLGWTMLSKPEYYAMLKKGNRSTIIPEAVNELIRYSINTMSSNMGPAQRGGRFEAFVDDNFVEVVYRHENHFAYLAFQKAYLINKVN